MADILCPYCMRKVTPNDLVYACPACGTPAAPSLLERKLHKAPVCKQSGCNKRLATDRQCPHCNAKLPSDILDYKKYLRFSILGISGAGKSNFLTTMLHEVQQSGMPWVMSPMDRDTQLIFREQEQAIYYEGEPVAATPAGAAPQPQQWKVQDKSKMTSTKIPSYSLTIFDGAGEDQSNINPVISNYISGSKTLVILIDPLALYGVRNLVDNDVLNWSSPANLSYGAANDLVNGLADYIRTSLGIKVGKLINKDVAVVFTKMDAVFHTFGGCMVTQPSPHPVRKAFVKADADAVDMEIRDWLSRQGEMGFIDAIETAFGDGKSKKNEVRFFGVSSFGQPPKGENQLQAVVPHRVLDPLMWALAKDGIVPTV